MNDKTSVGNKLQSLEVGPEFDVYTRVIIHAGQVTDAQGNTEDRDFIVGNTTGRTMEVTDPLGTREKANALLAKLKNSKWQYQPYTASGALLDPAAELGDGVSLADSYSAVYSRDMTFSALMAQELSAPSDEEIDHEFPYIPKAEREYKRETAYTRSQIKINANEISAEVSRASGAEGTLSSRITANANSITTEVSNRQSADNALSSRITQNATDITAKVSKTGGTRSSFAWSLQDDNFSLIANNRTVFKATEEGINVYGRVTATSGYIGDSSNGFTIGNTFIRNGMTKLSDTVNDGIYLGTDGIALGKGNFSVTKAGVLTAKSGTIGGVTMNASYGLYTNGKTSATSTATGFLISKAGAIYLGAYNSTTKACPFQVTATGKVTANDMNITGGSISIKDNGVETFKVTNVGKVTANDLNITGGTISIKDGGIEKFKVANNGEVTASNLKIKGGTINIGSKFSVDAEGNVNATALSLRGGSISLGSKFSVSSDGTMKATGAEFSGNITATSGYIGSSSSGFNIGNNSIWNGTGVIGGQTYKKNVYNQDQVDGIYIGTDGIALGKGKFKVDKYGKLKATDIQATGGTIGGFQITNNRIMNFDFDNNTGIWMGAESTGKCFQIGENFRVNADGDIVANNGTFRGTLSAGDIHYGSTHGTFSGDGITSGSITGGKIGTGQIWGGTDSYGYPTGHISSGSVSYGNVGFTGTLDQVGVNQSNIEAINGYFTGRADFNYLRARDFVLGDAFHYNSRLTIGNLTYNIVTWGYGE